MLSKLINYKNVSIKKCSTFLNMSLAVSVVSRTPHLTKELQKVAPNLIFHEVKSSENDPKLCESQILIGDYDLLGPYLYNLPKVKWLQGTWAGVESLIPHIKDNPPNFPITRFSGQFFGRLMSEYVVANIVNRERDLFLVRDNQLKNHWTKKGIIMKHRAIYDLSIGIMGLGNIGNVIGRTLKYMGAEVHGYGRRANLQEYTDVNYISAYYNNENFAQFLQNCDYIVNVLPSTPETRGLLNGGILENCKEKGTVLINIGRGSLISESDLVKAVQNQWIGGAILDVYEKEPLDENSPLWKLPGVFLTPHVAGVSRAKDMAALFAENFKRFQEKLPLLHLVDFQKGY